MPNTPATVVNYWPKSSCARAFWSQRELPPYRRLLKDTAAWLDPRPGQRWLDLGCGSGQLTRTLWEKSGGRLAEIIALDCAAHNERAIAKVRDGAHPPATAEQMRFLHADFSDGLASFASASLDGAVSGLAIQYAESYSEQRGCWTAEAYEHLLADVCRVLRPGGTFVFSVNVPEPAWSKIAIYGIPGFFRSSHPLRYVKNSLRMLRYGAWLKREARRGRFHYLSADVVADKLARAGFTGIEHRLSFAGQADVFRCRRPA
ncbi:MAG TPA: methyltransferase domain-containing protein [Gemmataceae bacterium]|jgi:SAM-dependent methyltransferase